jgi:uncharacterized protein (UPF0248 family)
MNDKIKKNPRMILNEIKWDNKFDLKKINIYYLHRGAFDDTKIIHGKDIKSIGRSFIEIDNAMIPYHRILKIDYDNKFIFKRLKNTN